MIKKIAAVFAFTAFAGMLSAQSFDKGTMVAELNFNFGVYKTESQDKINNTKTEDGAASKMYSGSFEYGIFPWLGAGVKLQYSSYIVDPDTIFHTPPQQDEYVQPTVGSFDPAVFANFHLGKRDHFDLAAGFSGGPSFFAYKIHDANDSRATGTGFWYDIHLSPRFYFGNHFGLHLNIAYASFNYPNLIAESSSVSAINSFGIKGSGVNIGAGLQVKF